MKREFMKSKPKKRVEDEDYNIGDFDLSRPEVIREAMNIKPKYEGKLKMLRTSVSLPNMSSTICVI